MANFRTTSFKKGYVFPFRILLIVILDILADITFLNKNQMFLICI